MGAEVGEADWAGLRQRRRDLLIVIEGRDA